MVIKTQRIIQITGVIKTQRIIQITGVIKTQRIIQITGVIKTQRIIQITLSPKKWKYFFNELLNDKKFVAPNSWGAEVASFKPILDGIILAL